MGCAESTEVDGQIDLARPWSVAARVAIRPEPFGALAYHFGTRRLSFLKSRTLLTIVESLGHHESALGACTAAGVTEDQLPAYQRALTTLAESGMIQPAAEGAGAPDGRRVDRGLASGARAAGEVRV